MPHRPSHYKTISSRKRLENRTGGEFGLRAQKLLTKVTVKKCFKQHKTLLSESFVGHQIREFGMVAHVGARWNELVSELERWHEFGKAREMAQTLA